MGFHTNILKVKSRNKIVEIQKKLDNRNFCLLFMGPFVGTLKLIGKFSNEIPCNLRKNLGTFRLYNFFKKFMVVEISTSEDEHFRNAVGNNIEKLRRQIVGVISKPFFYLAAISLLINLIRFVHLGIKII